MRLLVVIIAFIFQTTFALATDATIALSKSTTKDPFFSSLIESETLYKANIKLTPSFVDRDEEALERVLKGTADFALVGLDAFANQKIGGDPLVASLFTRPLLFDNLSQVYLVQDTELGSAGLSDISRMGLVSLGYWNRGELQLITKEPLSTARELKSLKIGFYEEDNVWKSNDVWLFTKLGAGNVQSLRPADLSVAFENGSINAAVVDWPADWLLDDKLAPAYRYASPIRPLVGMLVANSSYWHKLKEAEKKAWRQVTDAAQLVARQAIATQAIDLRAKYQNVKMQTIPLPENKKITDLLKTGSDDDSFLLYQYNSVSNFLAASRAVQDKKKLNNQP
jgi:TRAP-type C4-dicarboxylate transport system substrate-binding protein